MLYSIFSTIPDAFCHLALKNVLLGVHIKMIIIRNKSMYDLMATLKMGSVK